MTQIALPIALGIIMFGVGLSITLGDFARVVRRPKAVFIALSCQIVLLPLVSFDLVIAFHLPPMLAVGMMLLAAAPGGTTAKLFSHLFRGDVALNISLAVVNAVITVVTLPLITNIAIAYFVLGRLSLSLNVVEMVKILAIVLLPAALGMLVRRFRPRSADAMGAPVRILSIAILVVVIAASVVSNLDVLVANFVALAAITTLFCFASLNLGYWSARLLRVERSQVIASAFEVGIHNATLAIVIAQSMLGSVEISLPAAVYAIVIYVVAAGFGLAVRRWGTRVNARSVAKYVRS
ncbi:MAG: bile acid:sodium symporter family protein [Terrimesophilobacter sp.]